MRKQDYLITKQISTIELLLKCASWPNRAGGPLMLRTTGSLIPVTLGELSADLADTLRFVGDAPIKSPWAVRLPTVKLTGPWTEVTGSTTIEPVTSQASGSRAGCSTSSVSASASGASATLRRSAHHATQRHRFPAFCRSKVRLLDTTGPGA